jgi:hypothetical protein
LPDHLFGAYEIENAFVTFASKNNEGPLTFP